MKTAEFLDFSGGLTDRDIPGKTNRLSTADNVLLDADKKLVQRDGFDIFSSTAYQLAAAERVARLVSFNQDSELLAFQNKKAFAISAGAWTEVLGPNSLRAFPSNTADSLLEEAQWNKHCYIATNSGDPPIKMYRDNSNVLQLRTAGLPAAGAYTAGVADLTPSDGGLALGIALANDLRTQMIAHFGSNGAAAGTVETVSTKAHITHADLTAQASAVSASTAATNLASLITLLNVLRTQYSNHIGDAQKQQPPLLNASTIFERDYHVKPAAVTDYYWLHNPPNQIGAQPSYSWFHFLNLSLEDPFYSLASSTLIADVLPYLNDLRDKWNWHQYSTLTHFNSWRYRGSESYTQLGVHATSLARVEPYTWAKIDRPIGAFVQYVKDLKTEYDAHCASDMHHQLDTVTAVPSGIDATPDDLWEAVTLLGWLAHSISLHSGDMVQPTYQLTCTSTSADPILATGEAVPATNALRDFWCIPLIGTGSTPWAWSLDFTLMPRLTSFRVASNISATSITCANAFGSSISGSEFLFTVSQYHLSGTTTATGFSGQDANALSESFNNIDYRFSTSLSLEALGTLAETVAELMKDHALAATELFETQEFSDYNRYSVYYGKKYERYKNTSGFGDSSHTAALGTQLLIHMHPSTEPTLNTWAKSGALFYPFSAANGSGFEESRFTAAPDAFSINYRMAFRYDYYVGSTLFTDRSAPSTPINVIGFENQVDGESNEKGKFSVELSNIYAHTNSSVQNYAISDTTNWRKEIYRTIDTGQLYYRTDVNQVVGDISNATTTYSDYSQDDYLVNQVALYTNGGISENDPPPLATALHYALGRMYYVKGNRLYQSIPGDFDSVPGDFFVQADEDLIGVSSTRNVVVAFGQNRIYRVAGVRDEFGNGEILLDPIFDRSGAISAGSIVKADNGIFFAGKDGFYFTDGYQCMRVSDPQDTYISYTNTAAKRARVQGAYDNVEKRVYWTIQTGSGSAPDKIWVLDLQYGINADETPITTFSTLHSFNPTALCFYGGALHFGDADGYTWKQTLDRSIDAKKDTAVAATSWNAAPIIWDVKSCNHDYGSMVLRKYFTRVTAQFEMQDTNLSVQINSDADKGRSVSALPVIRSRKLATAAGYGDSKMSWVTDLYTTKAGDVVDEFRMFKGDGFLRANFRALQFTNAYTVIANSTEMGTITVGNVAGNVYSATLVSLVLTRAWPLYSVDYYLRLSGVDYPVTIRSSDSAIRFDATGLAVPATGSPDSWELWGKPKGERMRMIGYTVNYAPCDDQETDFKGNITSAGTVAE